MNSFVDAIGRAAGWAWAQARGQVSATGRLAASRTVRLGVTGLSRSGKTVFVTSLIQNMRLARQDKTRLPFLGLAADDQLINVRVTKIPALTPFPLRRTIAALEQGGDHWPEPTRGLSGLRLAIDYRPGNWLIRQLTDRARLNVEIIDYPGEWLLDLSMARQDFAAWSRRQYDLMQREPRAALAHEFLDMAAPIRAAERFDQERFGRALDAFRAYLRACRGETAGLSDVQPGRLLVPGDDVALAERLAFFPLPPGDRAEPLSGTFGAELARRYRAYVDAFVTPFARRYFHRFDRQIVLVDVLTALQNGKTAFGDMRTALIETLAALRYGSDNPVMRLAGARIGSVMIAASKADHVTPDQYPALIHVLRDAVAGPHRDIEAAGARVSFDAVAAIRCTRYDSIALADGRTLPALKGRVFGETEITKRWPGTIPPTIAGDETWPENGWSFVRFGLPPRDGPWFQHIGLDRALQDLLAEATR
jgi:hypothetical protein